MKVIVLVLSLFLFQWVHAQKMTAQKSFVSFFSKAAIEDIKAENKKAISLFNTSTNEIVFSISIKEFEFDKALMKEHFNEKYMESEKFPKATFSGKVNGFTPTLKSEQAVVAKGKLTIHGVTKEVEVSGTMNSEGDEINIKSAFKVKLEDYKIRIPQLLWKNIAEEIEVKIDFSYKP